MTNPLQNRVAVVTGAARGIGRACAAGLAQAGADVVGIDIAGPVSAPAGTPPTTNDPRSSPHGQGAPPRPPALSGRRRTRRRLVAV